MAVPADVRTPSRTGSYPSLTLYPRTCPSLVQPRVKILRHLRMWCNRGSISMSVDDTVLSWNSWCVPVIHAASSVFKRRDAVSLVLLKGDTRSLHLNFFWCVKLGHAGNPSRCSKYSAILHPCESIEIVTCKLSSELVQQDSKSPNLQHLSSFDLFETEEWHDPVSTRKLRDQRLQCSLRAAEGAQSREYHPHLLS